jgi:hypothetical protein
MYPTAPSFKEERGGCFFAWYTATITGNGDIRPCCLLLDPSVKPLGNIHDGKTFTEHWNGLSFGKMRDEMREVLLMKQKAPYAPSRFEILKVPCVTEGLCWLKNMYFRGDADFYAELDQKPQEARKSEIRWTGTKKQRKRAADHLPPDTPTCEERVGLGPRLLAATTEDPEGMVWVKSDGGGVRRG